MYYHVTSEKDIKRILKRHPTVIEKSLSYLVRAACWNYGATGAIYVSNSGAIEYCDIGYYQKNEPVYGTQGRLIKELKYNKEKLKGIK